MMVQRWEDEHRDSGPLVPDPGGHWVEHYDYAALEKRNAALEAQVARVYGPLMRARFIHDPDNECEHLRAAYAALSACPEPLAVVEGAAKKDGRSPGTITYSLPYLVLDDPDELMPKYLPVRVIVMPGEEKP